MNMVLFYKLASLVTVVSFLCLPLASSYEEIQAENNIIIHVNNEEKAHHKMSQKMSSEIVVHGFLYWVSMGFLMPVGILTMRMAKRRGHATRLKLIFYIHATVQIISVLLATTGAVLSIRNFENAFNNIHQRMGLALYFLIWLQALTGIFRPKWGKKGRNLWYLVHCISGSSVSLVGVINIYTGLQAYQQKTRRSSRVWTIIFSIQISFFSLLYLIQEKWEYIQKQGISLGNEPVQPTDQDSSLGDTNQKEARPPEPC